MSFYGYGAALAGHCWRALVPAKKVAGPVVRAVRHVGTAVHHVVHAHAPAATLGALTCIAASVPAADYFAHPSSPLTPVSGSRLPGAPTYQDFAAGPHSEIPGGLGITGPAFSFPTTPPTSVAAAHEVQEPGTDALMLGGALAVAAVALRQRRRCLA